MKILHTADWHLGRIFNNQHLTEDQAVVLDQLLECIEQHKPEVLLIAGDVYDRSVPPESAIDLLDQFLTTVLKAGTLKVFMIAGNHDGAGRLNFGSEMFERAGLYVTGKISKTPLQVCLQDVHGPVYFYPLPFANPVEVRNVFRNPKIATHDEAMQQLTDRIRKIHPSGARSVVIAHAFVAGGEESESERLLSVGGSAAVRSTCFQGFDYVALGHLHRSQTVGAPNLRYSGSLMKYSFSEVTHEKSITMVNLNETGVVEVETIPLSPEKDVRHLEGFLQDILEQGKTDPGAEDYLRIKLLDTGALLDPMNTLREVYPNLLELQRNWEGVSQSKISPQGDYQADSPFSMFRDFFEQVEEEPLKEDQEHAFLKVVDPLLHHKTEERG